MKNQRTLFASLLLLLVLAFSCQQEEIVSTDRDAPNIQALITDPPCGPFDTLSLALATGDLHVDYCGPLPCPPTTPEWGFAELYSVDGQTSFANITLTPGWFVSDIMYEANCACAFN